MDPVVRVAVIGAGAVGGYVGARLAAVDGISVTMCVRRPFASLRLERGGETTDAPVEVVTEPEAVPPVDWVLLATKAYDAADAAPWLQRLCRGGVPLAVLQNGVDHESRVRAFVDGPILPVVIRFGGRALAPGHILVTGEGDMAAPATELGEEYRRLCARAGLDVTLDADFTTTVWTKFAYNLTGNTLTAILDRPVARIPGVEALRPLVVDLLEECRAVATAEGARLDPDIGQNALRLFAEYTDATLSSMLQDRRRSRPLEVEALTGSLIRLARLHAIPVPKFEVIDSLLQGIDELR